MFLPQGVNQINILIGTIIASFESGAVSYLYYADRIYQLPLALTGIAIATVILPSLSREVFKSKLTKVNFIQNRSLELCLFLCIQWDCIQISSDGRFFY